MIIKKLSLDNKGRLQLSKDEIEELENEKTLAIERRGGEIVIYTGQDLEERLMEQTGWIEITQFDPDCLRRINRSIFQCVFPETIDGKGRILILNQLRRREH